MDNIFISLAYFFWYKEFYLIAHEEMVKASREVVQADLDAGAYVDYTLSPTGTSFACITQSAIKDVLQKVQLCCCCTW